MATAATLSYFTPPDGITDLGRDFLETRRDLLIAGQNLSQEIETPDLRLSYFGTRDAITSKYFSTERAAVFASHFAKLEAITRNSSLWVPGTEPPNTFAQAMGLLVLQQLQNEDLVPSRVVASAEGGAAICFVSGTKYADIECLNNGVILGVTSNKRDRPLVWEVKSDPISIAQACSRIRDFLFGTSKADAPRQSKR